MAKNYRRVIDSVLDMEEPDDLEGLAMACQNLTNVLRMAIANRDIAREKARFDASLAPWFDPSHPMNAPLETSADTFAGKSDPAEQTGG